MIHAGFSHERDGLGICKDEGMNQRKGMGGSSEWKALPDWELIKGPEEYDLNCGEKGLQYLFRISLQTRGKKKYI